MRLRTDEWMIAGWRRAMELGALVHEPGTKLMDELLPGSTFPIAKIGDVWVVRWWVKDNEKGPLAGYALTCPKEDCEAGVHPWTTASNCGQPDPAGKARCLHEAEKTSCWDWSGSASDGTLTAHPSLHCVADRGGCGWHGWLRDGVMTSV